MCTVKTPKIAQGDQSTKVPEPTVIRNPYLDGGDPAAKALRKGRNSLRIDRAAPSGIPGSGAANAATPSNPTPATPRAPAFGGLPVIPSVRGGGGGNRGRLDNLYINLA